MMGLTTSSFGFDVKYQQPNLQVSRSWEGDANAAQVKLCTCWGQPPTPCVDPEDCAKAAPLDNKSLLDVQQDTPITPYSEILNDEMLW